MKKNLILAFIAIIVWNCRPSNQEELPNSGTINIAADESLKPIAEAQKVAYNAHYPNAVINIFYVPEHRAMSLMLNDSVNIALVTREATPAEQEVFTSNKIPYLPAKMALDGVALITNPASSIENIGFLELKSMFQGNTKKEIKLVFDQSNSSNLNLIMGSLGLKEVKNANIFAANGNKEVIEYIQKNPNAIGFIGTNWISDADDSQSRAFLSGIKVLGVSSPKNETVYYKPDTQTLRSRKYPFERKMMLHTKKSYGLTSAFIRFCCAQIGQLVVEKAGLIPYYIYERQIILDKKASFK